MTEPLPQDEGCPIHGCEVDALGRHDGYCDRAIQLGLPRRAEGEEPIVKDLSEDIRDGSDPLPREEDATVTTRDGVEHDVPGGSWDVNEGEEQQDGWTEMDGWQCVACLEGHIYPQDKPNCLKIGKSLVHPNCKWRVYYEGMEAHDVIEQLEKVAVDGGTRGDDLESVRRYVQDVVLDA